MKSGFVAVAGRPNVGKSTLVNALAGGKVAIVSDKPQTTRRRIAGVVNGDGYQLVLVDLPGFQRPLDPMTERMQRTVDQAFEDVDAVLLVLSARERIGAGDRFIAKRVFSLGVPVVIVLNKVDNLKGGHIATQMETASKLGDFHALHPVSAKTRDGIDALARRARRAVEGRACLFPGRPAQRSVSGGGGGRAHSREGARAHAGGGAACDLGRGRGDRRQGRARERLRRDRVAEADRGRQGRLGREGDRHPGAAGDRAPGWATRSSSSCRSRCGRNGAATRACSSASGSDDRARLRDAFDIDAQRSRNRDRLARRRAVGVGPQASRGARRAAPRRWARCCLHLRSQPRDRDGRHRVRRVGPASAPGSAAPRVQLRRAERSARRRDRRAEGDPNRRARIRAARATGRWSSGRASSCRISLANTTGDGCS